MNVGIFVCALCTDSQTHTDENCDPGWMRCSKCGTLATRPQAARLILRLYVLGVLNVAAIEQLSAVAKVLGADADTLMVTENANSHYLEISADHVAAQVEIGKMKKPPSS